VYVTSLRQCVGPPEKRKNTGEKTRKYVVFFLFFGKDTFGKKDFKVISNVCICPKKIGEKTKKEEKK